MHVRFMVNIYEIVWTDHALAELQDTIHYLETKFSQREISRLAEEIERILAIISRNPTIFPSTEKENIRKAVILKFNSMYFRIKENEIQILSFFSNRQSPDILQI